MIDLATARELFAYTSWADALVWQTVLGDAGAAADARVRDTLSHAHRVQRVFLKVWRGEPLDPAGPDAGDLGALFAAARRTHEELASFLDGLADSALGEAVVLPFAGRVAQRVGREPAATTMGDTLFQLVNHSTHHRGQVSARLRGLGGTPPTTDFIMWALLGKPEGEWPAADAHESPA